jgi:hypothetical protein
LTLFYSGEETQKHFIGIVREIGIKRETRISWLKWKSIEGVLIFGILLPLASIFCPLTASIGDSVKIIVTVKNAGTADAAGEGYYSLDVYDGTELLYSTRGSPTKEPLKPGGVIIADSRWWSFTTAGDHIIKAVVDPENKVQELDETNNEKTAPLSIGGSDFTISATPASLTVIQGEQATSTITIISKGKFSGQISLSCTVSDKLFSNKPTVTVSIEPAILTLESNGEVNATLTIRIGQNCPAGTKLVTVSASDNTKTHSVQVTVEIPKPDLVWYPIKIEPPEPKEGDPLSIEAILANQGPGKVSGGFTVRLEIIKYPYEIGELVYERELTVLTDLNPRSFWKFSWEDQGFTFEAANYEIRLIADPYNRIDEWNEDNNMETISIWVSYMSYLYRNAGFNQMKSGGASILCHMEIERDKSSRISSLWNSEKEVIFSSMQSMKKAICPCRRQNASLFSFLFLTSLGDLSQFFMA